MAAYELVVVGLRLWLVGSLVFSFFAVSDLLFSAQKRRWQKFARRLFFVTAWPLALCSARGREALGGKLEGI